jgi:CRISPR/Cas system-associated exonuclease Cas4 (RecB family)
MHARWHCTLDQLRSFIAASDDGNVSATLPHLVEANLGGRGLGYISFAAIDAIEKYELSS